MKQLLIPGTMAVILVISGCSAGPKTETKAEKVAAKTKAPEKAEGTQEVEARLKTFIDELTARLAPMELSMNQAAWDAYTTGKKESYAKMSEMELKIRKLFSNADEYKILSDIQKGGKVESPLLKLQLTILYLAYKENQADTALLEQIVNLSNEIAEMFNKYRGKIDGKEVTDNDVYDILKSSKDSGKRKKAWETYKARGTQLKDKVLTLVKLRNQLAKKQGFENFYQMRLELIEQDAKEIQRMFDELATQTDEPFKQLMDQVNAKLAKRYGIKATDLKPWHYEDPFFQEAPTTGKVDLDPFFKGKDQKALINGFFKGVDLDPQDIIDRSDLFEKEGKSPHAFCFDIDRKGDVRILCNLRDSEKWASTFLHEMGHAVYNKYIDSGLPWLLRDPSHSFTTEAVAMFFGRLSRNPGWLQKMLKLPAGKIDPVKDDIKAQLRLAMLVFARWDMVVTHFEREMYKNPDQDLNKLWWDLKERYQLVKKPEGRDAPDWASKIHIALYPAYYHNYLLGEMMASQLLHHVATKEMKVQDLSAVDFVDQKQLGSFMREKIFKPGKSLRWDQLLIEATGETLNPKYFAEQFVN